MHYETIKYDKEAGHCLITLNRPERLNAMSQQMFEEIDRAVDELTKDDEIKTFIFTGASRPDGRPCFSAGHDLKEDAEQGLSMPAVSPTAAFWAQRQPKAPLLPAFEKIVWCPKISIAAIDGICTAGGTELALSCDIILTADTARISDMHVKNLGWIGGAANAGNMALRIGASRAMELCCSGDVIDGNEAYRIGFANHVFPSDKLMEKARELATKIGSMRLAAVAMTKATCLAAQDMDRKTLWRYCDDAFLAVLRETDAAEWGAGRWVRGR
ncbi:MAG: enoyl-CoA hydratase/isomerase family protein [Chloroflexi bacterium]|nr:enoyl-CoA hydratase/isomerase family protein [Chloroflexota bacterium]